MQSQFPHGNGVYKHLDKNWMTKTVPTKPNKHVKHWPNMVMVVDQIRNQSPLWISYYRYFGLGPKSASRNSRSALSISPAVVDIQNTIIKKMPWALEQCRYLLSFWSPFFKEEAPMTYTWDLQMKFKEHIRAISIKQRKINHQDLSNQVFTRPCSMCSFLCNTILLFLMFVSILWGLKVLNSPLI